MKKIKVIGLCFLFIFSGKAQQAYLPLATEHKFWIHINYTKMGEALSGFMYTIEGDSLIDNIVYKKLYKYGLAGSHPCQFPPCFEFDIPYKTISKTLTSLLREDTITKQIYNLPGNSYCSESEHLVFDFNVNVGDSLNQCIRNAIAFDPESTGIVDSLSQKISFEKLRPVIYTTGIQLYIGLPPIGEVEIVEGVGFRGHGIFHFAGNTAPLVDYCEGTLEDCNITISFIQTRQQVDVEFFPNPVRDVLQIKTLANDFSIQIFDFNGCLLLQEENVKELDLRSFASTMLILKFLDKKNHKVKIGKIVRQQ